MSVLGNLKPEAVFKYFEEISAIPRGTGHTEAISCWCEQEANRLGLPCRRDQLGNVIITKEGKGKLANREPVILQGHLDMVCVKSADSEHDFLKDPIDLYVEDGYVRARGTSLGGDDGIAIAMCMAILASETILHPPLECIFTVEEETTMRGARDICLHHLKGRRLINLDSEHEGCITAGCAGNMSYQAEIPIEREKRTGTSVNLTLSHLRGGHSGNDIHKQRANAIKLMAAFLYPYLENGSAHLISFSGGMEENSIPAVARAEILVESGMEFEVILDSKTYSTIWRNEFCEEEKKLDFHVSCEENVDREVIREDIGYRIMAFLHSAPQGVMSWRKKQPDVPQSSVNLGISETRKDVFRAVFLARSTMASRKETIQSRLSALTRLAGGKGECLSEIPEWSYREHSPLREILVSAFWDTYGYPPEIHVDHASLECAYLVAKLPGLDAVSMGPVIKGNHSIYERMDIASVERTWTFLLKVLSKC